MRVLLTGYGRLGRPLLAELQRRGITGTVLLHRSDAPSLPPGWRSVRGDVTSPASLAGLCAECDEVLHLAGVTHSNRASRYAEVNAQGTANLIAEARRAGVRRFTLVSTRAISPAGGAYSRSRIAAEEIVRGSSLAAWTIVRIAEVYGAGGEGISGLIERCRAGRWIPIPGDGSAKLAPVYLDDVVDGLCRVVASQDRGNVHLFAGPEEMTYLELVRRLAAFFETRPRTVPVPISMLNLAAHAMAYLPIERPPLYADQVARLLSPKSCDIESAVGAFGFRARTLEQGLASLTSPSRTASLRSGEGT